MMERYIRFIVRHRVVRRGRCGFPCHRLARNPASVCAFRNSPLGDPAVAPPFRADREPHFRSVWRGQWWLLAWRRTGATSSPVGFSPSYSGVLLSASAAEMRRPAARGATALARPGTDSVSRIGYPPSVRGSSECVGRGRCCRRWTMRTATRQQLSIVVYTCNAGSEGRRGLERRDGRRSFFPEFIGASARTSCG